MNSRILLSTAVALSAGQFLANEVRGAEPKRASPLPVLLVIANADYDYREYTNTRRSLEGARLSVKVAAATTDRAMPAPNSGQPTATDGGVIPDLPLASANSADYSAIVFVGGWGASSYQYAYNDPNLDGTIDNYYANSLYNGDANLGDGKISETKVVVNELINDFVDQDKYVAAICHGVSVLAWARVDGVSPLQGRKAASSLTGAPATYYLGQWYADHELPLHAQVVVNGGFTNPYSGQFGDPTTVADDVIVDGRIITAENYDSARQLGGVLAKLLGRSGGN